MSRTPIHPGEILKEELEELNMSASKLAEIIDVPANRISLIVAGKRAVSADTSLRLAQYFGTSPDFWLNLQMIYELDLAKKEIGNSLSQIPQREVRHLEGAPGQL